MSELGRGLCMLLVYILVMVSVAVIVRCFVTIADEVFRKLLHCILLGSLLVWTNVFSRWWLAAGTALGFAAALYPVLALAERIPGFLPS